MSRLRGFLKPMLRPVRVPDQEEWPSTDSDDPDYSPHQELTQKELSSESSESEDGCAHLYQHSNSKRKHEESSEERETKRTKSSSLERDQPKTNGENSALDHSPCDTPIPSLPQELWLHIFQLCIESQGPLPFLCRTARVCHLWYELSAHPSFWRKIDLSYHSHALHKSCDKTLKWLAQYRLSKCREISLTGWKNLTDDGLLEVCDHCPDLEVINLSHCSRLTSRAIKALAKHCRQLRDLNLSFVSVDAASILSMVHVAALLGDRLTSLNLAGIKLKDFMIHIIMERFPNLDTLDLSHSRSFSGCLTLDVEKLQTGCPLLRVLRLAFCRIRANMISRDRQRLSPGFPRLEQFKCAMPCDDLAYIGPTSHLLNRLLFKAERLQVLDLRCCTRLHLCTLVDLHIPSVQEVYLGRTDIPRVHDNHLVNLLAKWRKSLKVLDLSWTTPHEDELEEAISELGHGTNSVLTHCNLAGSTVTLPTVQLLTTVFTHLTSLNLSSCRALPRGIKRLHEGTALDRLTNFILEKAPSEEDNSGSDTDGSDTDGSDISISETDSSDTDSSDNIFLLN